MNTNRCPECHGIAKTIITDVDGKNYYHCFEGLTTFQKDEQGRITNKTSQIVPCDTITGQDGQKFTGTIAFVSNNRVKTLSVTEGKERR